MGNVDCRIDLDGAELDELKLIDFDRPRWTHSSPNSVLYPTHYFRLRSHCSHDNLYVDCIAWVKGGEMKPGIRLTKIPSIITCMTFKRKLKYNLCP